MIYIKDNFLSDNVYNQLMDYLNSTDYREVDTGDKSFWVWDSSESFDDIVSFELKNQGLLLIYFICSSINGTGYAIFSIAPSIFSKS